MASPWFTITYADGRKVDVRVSPKAQVMFERHFQKTMSAVSKDGGVEHAYYLAWAGLHCAGMEAADFDTFLGMAEEIEPKETDDAEDPSKKEAGLEPSSS